MVFLLVIITDHLLAKLSRGYNGTELSEFGRMDGTNE